MQLDDRNSFTDNIQDVFMIISHAEEEICGEIVVCSSFRRKYRNDEQMIRIKMKCCCLVYRSGGNSVKYLLPFESCVVLFLFPLISSSYQTCCASKSFILCAGSSRDVIIDLSHKRLVIYSASSLE